MTISDPTRFTMGTDGDHRRVPRVLLGAGRLWDPRQVAVPVGSVIGAQDGVRLQLTRDRVRELPPVELDARG